MHNDESPITDATTDVSTARLADLLVSRDPALIRAIEVLLSELREPKDTGSNWPSFLQPPPDPDRPG